jgi:hypothetical protein
MNLDTDGRLQLVYAPGYDLGLGTYGDALAELVLEVFLYPSHTVSLL